MALKIKNKTNQVIPVIIPDNTGGAEKRILPRETVILPLDKPTNQISQLIKTGKLQIR